MQGRIKTVTMQNFKGCTDAVREFNGKNVTIFGANATGKTTIVDAFTWCLFGKDSDGNEKFNIRPLNKEGTQIDNLDIRVTVVLDIDGTEKEFSRIQKQKWVKSRLTGETTLQGNINEYEVDGYPVNEKSYKEVVSKICDEELFKILTNPTCFPTMDWKRQREILMRFVGDVSDVKLAENNQEFVLIVPELKKAPSLDDMKAKYQKKAKDIEKEIDAFPVKINTLEKSKVDADLSALELQRNSLNEQIADVKEKMSGTDKQFKEYQKLSDGIMELRFSLTDLERKANEENREKRKKIYNEMSDAKSEIEDSNKIVIDSVKKIKDTEYSEQVHERELSEIREKWASTNFMEFDENSKFCELCGQQLPEEKISELVSEFEQRKKALLADIEEKGNKLKNKIEIEKDVINKLKKSNAAEEKRENELQAKIENCKNQLRELPETVDISGTDEYKEIQKQISEKESVVSQMNNTSDIRNEYMIKLDGLHKELIECAKAIALAMNNNVLDAEIEQLQKEQREKGQEQADCDKMLYLLDKFIKFKMETVSGKIQKALGNEISVKLFEQQLNGEVKQTCKLTVNGVPFNDLNNGHKIIARLNLIKALQNLYDVYLPVFVDNAESINDFNIPNMNCQLIKLVVPYIELPKLVLEENMSEEEKERATKDWEEQVKQIKKENKELVIVEG